MISSAQAGPARPRQLLLRPVPGTLDRVSVSTGSARWVIGMTTVHRVLGREAQDALFLRGCFALYQQEHGPDLLSALLGPEQTGQPQPNA